MGKVSFWRTSPPQPKKSKKAKRLERLRPKGTFIRQRKDGELYFSTMNSQGIPRGWAVEPAGRKWLLTQGVMAGDRVDGSIIRELIEMGYARSRAIEKPSVTTQYTPTNPGRNVTPW